MSGRIRRRGEPVTEEFARADWIAIVIETVAALAWGTGQNTAPIVKCHSEGDSPSLLSSFHP